MPSKTKKVKKPVYPVAPKRPSPSISVEEHQIIDVVKSISDFTYSMRDLKLPKGTNWRNVVFSIKPSKDNKELKTEIFIKVVSSVPDPAYTHKMEIYRKKMSEWKETLEAYEKDISEWMSMKSKTD